MSLERLFLFRSRGSAYFCRVYLCSHRAVFLDILSEVQGSQAGSGKTHVDRRFTILLTFSNSVAWMGC
jgi:hypothetical protein